MQHVRNEHSDRVDDQALEGGALLQEHEDTAKTMYMEVASQYAEMNFILTGNEG